MIIDYNDPNSYWLKNFTNKPIDDEHLAFGCFYLAALAFLVMTLFVVFYIFS